MMNGEETPYKGSGLSPSLASASIQVASSTEPYLLVRYFLDRPGYGLHNSSSRLWRSLPDTYPIVAAKDVHAFLHQQGILPPAGASSTSQNLLCEIYLDQFQSYMLLEVCEFEGIQLDFSKVATTSTPGVINIRLTDLSTRSTSSSSSEPRSPAALPSAPQFSLLDHHASHPPPQQFCNTSPAGLYAFSFTVWMETIDLVGELFNTFEADNVKMSFGLIWGPNIFFVSGLVQLIVGIIEAKRNNVYGATAFMTFGAFWLATGLSKILVWYFPDQINPEVLSADNATSKCLLNMWKLFFVFFLLKQTLALNRLSTCLISLLSLQVFFGALAGYNKGFQWMQFAFSVIVSVFALYVAFAEFTNEVYHTNVFSLYPWGDRFTKRTGGDDTTVSLRTATPFLISSDEVFGAPGRISKLQAMALELRLAGLENKPPQPNDNMPEHQATAPQNANAPAGKHSISVDVRAARPKLS
jgi:uncharacterized protein